MQDKIVDESSVSKVLVIGLDENCCTEEHGIKLFECHKNTEEFFFQK
jgi:hypothetical protein